jgi:hypothetical protein
MTITRSTGWFFIGIGLLPAIIRLLDINTLWSVFSPLDWFLITVSMICPPLLLWRYLKVAQGPVEEVGGIRVSIALGGYVPVWMAFRWRERVAGA